jgi:hypothetical protein
MKKLFAIIAIAGSLVACNSNSESTTTTDSTSTMTTTDSTTMTTDSTVAHMDSTGKMSADSTVKVDSVKTKK